MATRFVALPRVFNKSINKFRLNEYGSLTQCWSKPTESIFRNESWMKNRFQTRQRLTTHCSQNPSWFAWPTPIVGDSYTRFAHSLERVREKNDVRSKSKMICVAEDQFYWMKRGCFDFILKHFMNIKRSLSFFMLIFLGFNNTCRWPKIKPSVTFSFSFSRRFIAKIWIIESSHSTSKWLLSNK